MSLIFLGDKGDFGEKGDKGKAKNDCLCTM